MAQVLGMEVVEPVGMIGSGIPWRRVDWDGLAGKVEAGMGDGGVLEWSHVKRIVGDIPWAPRRKQLPGWWTAELCQMRADVRRLRRNGMREDYTIARKVYRARLRDAMDRALGTRLMKVADPDIFRAIDALDLRRIRPSMRNDDDTYTILHAGISDMIMAQLGPMSAPVASQELADLSGFEDICEADIVAALDACPKDTSPGADHVTYPFLRWLRKGWPAQFDDMVRRVLREDSMDLHVGEVVLIMKAAKPRYDTVKSWRTITLLSCFAKLLERIVLRKVVKMMDLGETQFGGRPQRGTHDAISNVLEFLHDNQGMKRMMISVDVEGGFDRLDCGLLKDCLVTRGCASYLMDWVGRWCEQRTIRLKFNGRLSGDYYVSQGVPQGSPLSLRYGPSIRTMILSYVDDTTILVAADTQRQACTEGLRLFDLLSAAAASCGLGFSALKTEWIGFGDLSWGTIELGDVEPDPVEDMRVLGYRFNRHLNWSEHINYGLARGLAVRNRIFAVTRRFGDSAGAGAWEAFR